VGPQTSAYGDEEGPRSPDGRVAALAAKQHGVVSATQLREAGLSAQAIWRRVRSQRLHRLYRGVYAVGHEALAPRGRYLAAVLACGREALLSHRAAGAIQGLLRSSGVIEVTAARGCKPRAGIVVHRSRLIHRHDRDEVDGIPCTSVARTLVDLADLLTEERLAKAVHQAEVLRVFDLGALERARAPGRRGNHRLERVLAAYRPEPELIRSEAERRL
jgi:predicted transcriptional regulator of viral defense system